MLTINWDEVLEDATRRLEWVAAQTNDPDRQALLLPMAGDGPEALPIPLPASVAKERRKALTRERMGRLLGMKKGERWAGREQGLPVGTFNPADITPEQAAALLLVVRRYVAAHSGPWARYTLSPEGQDDAVSRIIHHVWTRDYSAAGLGRGNLAGAVWQACALYRKTAWVGESALERTEYNRNRRAVDDAAPEQIVRGGCDNPARVAAAVEQAELGLWAPAVVNRGRKQARRDRGGKRMDRVAAAVAREALVGSAD